METQEITLRVKFIANSCDMMGYSNYVFENLDANTASDKYIMCVRFPNWDQKPFNINEIGFVTVKYVRAGVDKWFDGQNFIPYKYTNIIFLKFIALPQTISTSDILLD